MKHTKLFETFLSEEKFVLPNVQRKNPSTAHITAVSSTHQEPVRIESPNCASELCVILMPTITDITELVSNYSEKNDLVKIQTQVNKLQKLVTETIRSGTTNTGDIDWEKSPKAPIFVLNLANKYPQDEKKYHDLWYKAAARQTDFNYGAAIAIFRAYAKRENLLLEGDHEYEN